MENPEKILKEIGCLFDKVGENREVGVSECAICFDEMGEGQREAMECGDQFCKSCWKEYLENQIGKGSVCIFAECMKKGCKLICREEFYEKLVSPCSFQRYLFFLERSFVDSNPRIKWCPSPHCSNAISSLLKVREDAVQCLCGYSFW